MDIRGQRRSSNIEDRRGMSPVRKGVGLSVGGVLFLIVLSFFGINPLPFLGVATKQTEVEPQQPSQPYQESAPEAQLSELAGVTLAQTEETWGKLFGGKYTPPTMVMFSGQTDPRAAPVRPRWGRSTARSTRNSTSTSRSSRNWSRGSAPPAISPRPT